MWQMACPGRWVPTTASYLGQVGSAQRGPPAQSLSSVTGEQTKEPELTAHLSLDGGAVAGPSPTRHGGGMWRPHGLGAQGKGSAKPLLPA